MTADDLEDYLRALGLTVERLQGADNQAYTVVRDVRVGSGSLKGKVCDVGILRSGGEPYVVPSAIHTRPHLVEMGTHTTQASGIGEEWQYWSRRFDHVPSLKGVWAHVLTVLGEV
jgi:hypothetical protein